jgi:hypothetical protein
MCGSPETSREHAPPQCFFPKINEFGRDLRRNLITVPSCDKHNSHKSQDDEFFRSVILMTAAQTSDVGRHQFFGKFLRAVRRMPHVYRSFFRDRGTASKRTQHAMSIDRARFDLCADHLARAIFFHTFGRKWSFPVLVQSPNFYADIVSDAAVPDQTTMRAIELSRQFLGSEPVYGENPEVFRYRLRFDEAGEIYAFAAIFYEIFEVFTYSSKSTSEVAA